MPNGYTAEIYEGKNPSFRRFALQCARNFGALITMRDESMDAEIPEEFLPSTYHREELAKAAKRTSELLNMTDEACEAQAAHEFVEAYESWEKSVAKNAKMVADYNAMIEIAKEFKSPSPEHDSYAEFLVSTLRESRDFDAYTSTQPTLLSGKEWRANQFARATRDVGYHAKEWQKEIERTERRNAWVKSLFEALDAMDSSPLKALKV